MNIASESVPKGTTHFLRYASGHIVWCKIDEGKNNQLVLSVWDSGNEYWVPGIHSVDFYQSIGLHSVDDFTVTMPAIDVAAAPKGATHCENHGAQISWYRERASGLYVWRDGSWYISTHKSVSDLAKICQLGCIAEIVPAIGDFDGIETQSAVLPRCNEQQNKPSWADAPEWAEWLAQSSYGYWGFGSGEPERHDGRWYGAKHSWSGMVSEVLGDWRDTLERRPERSRAELEVELVNAIADALNSTTSGLAIEVISTLKKTPICFTASELMEIHLLADAELTKRNAAVCGDQKCLDATWHERGELPPVGTRCEALITSERKWVEIEVVCHRDGFALGWCLKDRRGYHGDEHTDFRPIRTERKLAIDEMMKDSGALPCETTESIMLNLYDAGYRKQETV